MYIQYVDNFLAQYSGHSERGTSCNKTNWSEMALQRTSLGYLRTWRNYVGALPETVCMRSAHDLNVENWDHRVPSSWRSWHVAWMWFPCFLGLNLVPRVSVSFRSVERKYKEERPWEWDWMSPFYRSLWFALPGLIDQSESSLKQGLVHVVFDCVHASRRAIVGDILEGLL